MNIKHSIKRQYSLIFGMMLLGAIILVSSINAIVLGRYYIFHKQKVLLRAYEEIEVSALNGDINSEYFDNSLMKNAAVNNIDVLILDSDTQTVKATDRNPKIMTARLLSYIFEGAESSETVYKDSKIQIQRSSDDNLNLEFLELWGMLSDNEIILIRTPIQSTKEAALIANRLLLIIGSIITIIGFVVTGLVTRRLTDPIKNLVSISEKMTKLDFSEKYVPGKGNEVDLLGAHINILSENLEQTIVELKNANAELQSDIEKKIEADEMRKDFISNVSHELKTPIALIQGYAEGLKDCINDDEESREFYCDVIIDEASRMNKMVRSLLELTELEFGQNNVSIEQFDIVELIHNCLSSFDIMLKNEGIKVLVPERAQKTLVWADEFKVEQVLSNYISNAIHYAKNEKLIKITLVMNENILRVSVFNSGDPIDESVIPNLWIKFYKADKARTREYGGSGIGLSIVKASMEAMGHNYGVINHNDGVEFWFEVDANIDIKCVCCKNEHKVDVEGK